jgi:hypothetical protein
MQYDLGFSVTGVHGRTVAVWTLLSCTLCFLCAFNLSSKPLYAATFLSIGVYAIGHLSVECVVYHTISAASLASFTFIAGIVQHICIRSQGRRHGYCMLNWPLVEKRSKPHKFLLPVLINAHQ